MVGLTKIISLLNKLLITFVKFFLIVFNNVVSVHDNFENKLLNIHYYLIIKKLQLHFLMIKPILSDTEISFLQVMLPNLTNYLR